MKIFLCVIKLLCVLVWRAAAEDPLAFEGEDDELELLDRQASPTNQQRIVEITRRTCNLQDLPRVADRSVCDKYYVCSQGFYVAQYCPAGLAFAPGRQECRSLRMVNCAGRPILYAQLQAAAVTITTPATPGGIPPTGTEGIPPTTPATPTTVTQAPSPTVTETTPTETTTPAATPTPITHPPAVDPQRGFLLPQGAHIIVPAGSAIQLPPNTRIIMPSGGQVTLPGAQIFPAAGLPTAGLPSPAAVPGVEPTQPPGLPSIPQTGLPTTGVPGPTTVSPGPTTVAGVVPPQPSGLPSLPQTGLPVEPLPVPGARPGHPAVPPGAAGAPGIGIVDGVRVAYGGVLGSGKILGAAPTQTPIGSPGAGIGSAPAGSPHDHGHGQVSGAAQTTAGTGVTGIPGQQGEGQAVPDPGTPTTVGGGATQQVGPVPAGSSGQVSSQGAGLGHGAHGAHSTEFQPGPVMQLPFRGRRLQGFFSMNGVLTANFFTPGASDGSTTQ